MTPPVPANLKPQARPKNEMFVELPGTGDKMPANGLGTCCRPSAYDHETMRRSALHFLLNGGRHIDTAQLYLNHKAIGEAIGEAILRGVPRSEIWVTTKLHERFYDRGEEVILGMVQEWMQELKVEYLDLVLLHQAMPLLPIGHSCGNWSVCREDAWRVLAKAKEKGWIKNIGVSNFNVQQLKELPVLEQAPIAANQIAMNPFAPDWVHDVADYCKSKSIAIMAWAPLSGTTMQTKQALDHDIVEEVAENYKGHKPPTTAQVILRWALQKGFAIIPGSGNPQHQIENLEIYDFQLTSEEMDRIEHLQGHADFMYPTPP